MTSLTTRLFGLAAVLAISSTLTTQHAGATPILDFDPTSPSFDDPGDLRGPIGIVIGTLFEVGDSPIRVTQLGMQDANGGTFTASQVGIWTGDGSSLLASVTVPALSPVDADDYAYAAITPITLSVNTQYLIGGEDTNGFWDGDISGATGDPLFIGDSAITLLSANFNGTIGLFDAPVLLGVETYGRWGSANAIFAAVPEPSPALLLGLGLAAFGSLTRRGRRALGVVIDD